MNLSFIVLKIFPGFLLTFFLLLILDKWLKVQHRKTLQKKLVPLAPNPVVPVQSKVSNTPSHSVITNVPKTPATTTNTTVVPASTTPTPPAIGVGTDKQQPIITNNPSIDINIPKYIFQILYSSTPDALWYATVVKQLMEAKYIDIFIQLNSLDSYTPDGKEHFMIILTQGNYVPHQYTDRKQTNGQLRYAIFNLESSSSSSLLSSSVAFTSNEHEQNCGYVLHRLFHQQWESIQLITIRTSPSKVNRTLDSSPTIALLDYHDQFRSWMDKLFHSLEPWRNNFYTLDQYNQFISTTVPGTPQLTLPPSSTVIRRTDTMISISTTNITSTSKINSSIVSNPSSKTTTSLSSPSLITMINSVNKGVMASSPVKNLQTLQMGLVTKSSVSQPLSSSQLASPRNNSATISTASIKQAIQQVTKEEENKKVMNPQLLLPTSTNDARNIPRNSSPFTPTTFQRKPFFSSPPVTTSSPTPLLLHHDDYHKHTIPSTVYDNANIHSIVPTLLDSTSIADTVKNITSVKKRLIEPIVTISAISNLVPNDEDFKPVVNVPVVPQETEKVARKPIRFGALSSTTPYRPKENTKNNEKSTDASSSSNVAVPVTTETNTPASGNSSEMPNFIKSLRSADYDLVVKTAKELQKEFLETQKHVFRGFGVPKEKYADVDPLALAGLEHELVIQTNGTAPGSKELLDLFKTLCTNLRVKGTNESAAESITICETILKKANELDNQYPNHPGKIPTTLTSLPYRPFTLMVIDTILARCLSIVEGEINREALLDTETAVATGFVVSDIIRNDMDIEHHVILRRYLGYIYTVCPLLIPDPVPILQNPTKWQKNEAAAFLHGHVTHTANIYIHLPEAWNPWSFFARIMKKLPPSKVENGEIARCLVQVLRPLSFICFKYIVQENNKKTGEGNIRGYGADGVSLLKTFRRYVGVLDKKVSTAIDDKKTTFTGNFPFGKYFSSSSIYKFLGDENRTGECNVDKVKNLENNTLRPSPTPIFAKTVEDDFDNDDDGGG